VSVEILAKSAQGAEDASGPKAGEEEVPVQKVRVARGKAISEFASTDCMGGGARLTAHGNKGIFSS
jgi:hypothetical protein